MRRISKEQIGNSKILVRVPNWVGDAVMCLPALRALRSSLPNAEIRLLARPWVGDIFAAEKEPLPVIAYDTAREHCGISGHLRIAGVLRAERFAAAILFQNAFDAALITALAGIPIRAGYARQARGPLLTHAVRSPRKGEIPQQEAHYYLELLKRLGLVDAYPAVEQISLGDSASRASSRAQLRTRLGLQRGAQSSSPETFLIGISPGASFGTAKRWSAQRFAELTMRLQKELGASCVFFGSAQERPLVDAVVAEANVPSHSLAGETSLGEFMQLVAGCDLYVTNDTGTMHVAAGLGVPTLAIFGPTNENETRPLGPHTGLVIGEAFCRPCKLRHCPIDHRCMTSVSVDNVFRAALSLLKAGGTGGADAPGATSHQAGNLTWQEHPVR